MTTKELIELLQTYPPESTVSVCHYDRGTTLREVEMVADNCGPSIYAEGWEKCAKTDAYKTPENAAATRKFEVRNIMIGHCGQSLTPDNVDSIAAEMLAAIETGPCAWAFGQNS